MIKDNLKYTKDHEWLRVDGEIGTIGITDFAQGELGDIVFVELPALGKTINAGDSFGTIEAVKTIADLYAPVSGEVVEVNKALADNAAVINSDCYNAGWIVRIRLSDSSEVDELLSPSEYSEMIGV